MILNCQSCGDEFKGNPDRRFCSPECSHKGLRKRELKDCKGCGRLVRSKGRMQDDKGYCSRICYRYDVPFVSKVRS